MAAELCLSQLPSLVEDPNAEFQVSGCFCYTSDVQFPFESEYNGLGILVWREIIVFVKFIYKF